LFRETGNWGAETSGVALAAVTSGLAAKQMKKGGDADRRAPVQEVTRE